MTPHLSSGKISTENYNKGLFNTYSQEDRDQDDKKTRLRMHKQPVFWDLLVPGFATLKLPITESKLPLVL